jgi:ABC-2 type transport system permease protein
VSAATAPAPVTPPEAGHVTRFVRTMMARAYVRLVGSLREPSFLFADAVFPTIGMAAYVMLYRALGAPKSFETLAVLGGVLSTYWLNVLWGMGTQLYWEKQQGQLQLYFVAPCSRMAILAGMALGGIAATTLRTVVALLVGFGLLGVRVPAFDVWALLGVFCVSMTALYALGMILSSAFLLLGREAWHLANAVQEPVTFLSGLYFPLSTFGQFGLVAATLVPLGLGVDALRQVLLGRAARGLMPVGTEVAILAALSVVLLLLARASLAHLETLAKREGRLTQRHQ